MTDIQLIILRRLRSPVIILITVYSIAIGGLIVMPGVDAQGHPWRMSLFDAFYAMSYTATTIGFGEIPYPFTYAQRLWMTVSIYLSVIGWAYALGSVFALTQHPAFREALAHGRFEGRVKRLSDPFYVICGFGQSGKRLADALDRLGFATVVIDRSGERLHSLLVQDLRQAAIATVGDARSPELLLMAGVRHPKCLGLVVLTAEEGEVQTIAIETKVLAPDLPVLAMVKSQMAHQILGAFGGVKALNPYVTFGYNVGMALTQPDSLWLEDWLTAVPGTKPPARVELPHGHWLLVGYGSFGRAISGMFMGSGLSSTGVDLRTFPGEEDLIVGNALNDEVLLQAGIERAIGIVAGTGSDATNLAVVLAARRLKPGVFVVIRQNQIANRRLIDAARAHMRFVQSHVMTQECLQFLTTQLLNTFLTLARDQPNDWAADVCRRMRDIVGDVVPNNWSVTCKGDRLGFQRALVERTQPALTIAHLLSDPDDREERLKAIALLLVRDGREILMPDENTPLALDDRILFAGEPEMEFLQRRLVNDNFAMDYVRTGVESPRTWVGRLIEHAQKRS
jgi:Trk K+ transport system NAD-binding subunit